MVKIKSLNSLENELRIEETLLNIVSLLESFQDVLFLVCRFSDKTLNNWEDRNKFVKHAGKYDLIAVDYEATVRNDDV